MIEIIKKITANWKDKKKKKKKYKHEMRNINTLSTDGWDSTSSVSASL